MCADAIRPACARTTTRRTTASPPLGGNQRRLRGVSWTGLAHVAWARERAKLVAVRQERRPDQGARWSVRRTRGRRLADRSDERATRTATSRPRCCARRSRPAASATRAAASFPRIGFPAGRCRTRMLVSPLARGLYDADGQMLDEVYNYGSFKQSKMFAAGVTCSDCHEPHGAKLRAPGDGVCLQCHAPDKYAALSRTTIMRPQSPPLACASCHMPARTYMVVDRRHDHSFRVPRPDLSAKLGTPNACNDCHRDKPAEWAAAAIERWYGPIARASRNMPRRSTPRGRSARRRGRACWRSSRRIRNAPAIRARDRPGRARALSLAIESSTWRGAGLRIPIRWCGSARSTCSKTCRRHRSGRSLRRCFRSQSRRAHRAAELLAAVPTASQPPADRPRFERAAAEFIAAQRLNADRPEARSALGSFLCAARPLRRGGSRIQGRAAAKPAIRAGGDQSRRSLPAARPGRRRRERAARRDRRLAAGRRPTLFARP